MRRLLPFMMLAIAFARSVIAQEFSPAVTDSPAFNTSSVFGHGAIDATTFCCHWPRWSVTEPTLTAIDLSSGALLWSKPANIRMSSGERGRSGIPRPPVLFYIDNGWLLYNTNEPQDAATNYSIESTTFHLVNTRTGAESKIPATPDRLSKVESPLVHRGYCVTPQGLMIECESGKTVGDLGSGEHRVIANGEYLYVTTLFVNESNLSYNRRILRRFDLSTMQFSHEMELPLEIPWQLATGNGTLAIGRVESDDWKARLVCIDIDKQTTQWDVNIPTSIRPTPSRWDTDSDVTLSMGFYGLIWPIHFDAQTGEGLPDRNWRDPRLLLAWHQFSQIPPDFVATNEKFIVGRWRALQLCCLDAATGRLQWDQRFGDYEISRVFSTPQLGEFIVAEAEHGLDIVSVATGERRSVMPTDVGLSPLPKKPLSHDREEKTEPDESLLSPQIQDWIWHYVLRFGPLIPLAVWLTWALIRRQFSKQLKR